MGGEERVKEWKGERKFEERRGGEEGRMGEGRNLREKRWEKR